MPKFRIREYYPTHEETLSEAVASIAPSLRTGESIAVNYKGFRLVITQRYPNCEGCGLPGYLRSDIRCQNCPA